jgi:hypothetical protein
MPACEYTATNLSELQRTLSGDRLRSYRTSVGGDRELAVRLYGQNTLLAESFYGVLQRPEVALRNTIHAQLTAGCGQAEWWDVLRLKPEREMTMRKAKDTLKREGKPLDAGRIVADLCFGFWTGLTGPKSSDLGNNRLVRIFPRRPVQRAKVQMRPACIRKLSNQSCRPP